MTKQIFSKLMIGSFLTFGAAPLAMAESTSPFRDAGAGSVMDESSADEAFAAACSQFDRQPRRCENNGCFFNPRNERCTRGGAGGRDYFVCDAKDQGFEEHWQGHSASG